MRHSWSSSREAGKRDKGTFGDAVNPSLEAPAKTLRASAVPASRAKPGVCRPGKPRSARCAEPLFFTAPEALLTRSLCTHRRYDSTYRADEWGAGRHRAGVVPGARPRGTAL